MINKVDLEEALLASGCYDLEANSNFITEYFDGKYLGTPVKDILCTEDRLAHFISQLAHESNGLRRLRENTNYTRDRIEKVFSKYCTSEERLDQMVESKEFLFNTVYGNRLGNDEPGDGYRFIGRGYIMRTGKANYRALSREFGIDFEQDPSLLENHRYAFYGAIFYFLNRKYKGKNIFENIDSGITVRRITRLINGGTHGLEDRIDRYNDIVESLCSEFDYSTTRLNSRSSFDDTFKAQYYLHRLGFNVGKPDGYFGSKTRSAYKAFEEAYNTCASLFDINEEYLDEFYED